MSINFVGVDNSSPDISVKDGAMAEMYNVRYNDDAWRPVHMFNKVCDISDDYTVVYHHPAAGENVYIVSNDSGNYYSYDVKTKVPTLFASPEDFVKDIKHFGNVLIFIGQDNSVEYYVLQDGKYYRFEKPTAPIVELEEGERTPAPVSGFCDDYKGWEWDIPEKVSADAVHPYGFWAIFDEGGSTAYPMSKDSKWWGEIAYFVAYRLKDGSIISPSPLGITSSEQEVAQSSLYRKWYKANFNNVDMWGILCDHLTLGAVKHTVFTHPQMQYYIPTLRVSVPSNLSPLVESVAVYTTRINSPFAFIEAEDTASHFADHKFAEQPFYLAKEVRISEMSSNSCKVVLDYTLLKDVTSHSVYTPNNNIHDIQFAKALDYNERLHIADITTILHTPEEEKKLYNNPSMVGAYSSDTRFLLSVDNNSYATDYVSNIANNGTRKAGYESIISYHDYRATKQMNIITSSSSNIITYSAIALKSAPNNNIAYAVAQNESTAMSDDSLHYKNLVFESASAAAVDSLYPKTIIQHNKVMVSQTNNPFAFDFANTYAFGSADNNVLAMQSAAVEMSDAKFGEYPLFVFTESGIFGLQSGAESVYSNVVPINYDRIINPRTLAINYNVVYITQKGIHLLNSDGSTLISQPIDTMLGYPDVEKLQRLYPLRSTQYNEISFVVDGIAYIYSLINGVWSTRSFDMHPISQEEAYRYEEIFNIINENAALPARCVIASRPIKLGSVEYKRLETFIPRFANLAETENMTIRITIEGSNDCKEWKELRKVDAQGYKVIRRTPQSCKYFRFILEFIDVEEFTFSNVDLEYYVKFLRRMR